MIMIGTFFLETAGRWSSSKGPLTTARLINKVEIINPKAAAIAVLVIGVNLLADGLRRIFRYEGS